MAAMPIRTALSLLLGLVLSLGIVWPAQAQTAPPPAATTAPVEPVQPDDAAPPVPAPAVDADRTLERVLRSGCRTGLSDVSDLLGNPDAVWADTVLRLCGKILRTPSATITPTVPAGHVVAAHKERGAQEGR